MYSLSSSSKNVVEKIEDLLTMKVYFSEDLPNELGNTKRYLQDLLEEYAVRSNDNLRFILRFLNQVKTWRMKQEKMVSSPYRCR